MSTARHHAEWLSLVETSGPFLSMPVLMRVFPQGLDKPDVERRRRLREAYEDWLERGVRQAAVHDAWVRHVLGDFLEYPATLLAEGQAIPPGLEASMPVFGETLRPDRVLKNRDAGTPPLLLVSIYPNTQKLDAPIAGKVWKASPATRMMELLHAADVPVGLITNGEHWMLVYAPRGETTGFASWYADLWMQEPITLQAFATLLHLRRFLGVAATDTLPALLKESGKDQAEVTDQLGYQVRRAVEMLVQAFDRIDADSGRKILAEVDEKTLYNSGLTVMMRLVFLFAAEERGLLLLGHNSLYDEFYAMSTLRDQLRERADQHGEEILERRHDAWCRLLSTFRAVHGGVEHPDMRLPAYGGSLFDPDRFPFLEGRAAGTRWRDCAATPLPINNRVVLHLLEALQILRIKVPGGGPAETRRLSFRALDIEQIGHVYEGLLDHTALRAGELVLGLAGARDKEPEILLSQLEQYHLKGTDALVAFLVDETGRSPKALKKALEAALPADEHRLLVVCGQDAALAGRVRPFAGLLRDDSFGQPVVILPGSVYVTHGTDRRSTGTHYTPRSLTEPIVEHTLEPLVYDGPAEGKPQSEWRLKGPREILSLKVCDMAMGSGAFLVQTCRYLSERLVEAWEVLEKGYEGAFLRTPEGDLSIGDPSERLLPSDPVERLAMARRYVADRCLYGVDINPMAVEMAKLSLWLTTLQRDRPFTFLNHALKCGDSLIGLHSIEQVMKLHVAPEHLSADEQLPLWFSSDTAHDLLLTALRKRQELESFTVNEIADSRRKERLLDEAEKATDLVRLVCDLVVGLAMATAGGGAGKRAEAAPKGFEKARERLLEELHHTLKEAAGKEQREAVERLRLRANDLQSRGDAARCTPFHWAIEFSEVFPVGADNIGFDAVVGNPPFLHGSKLSGIFSVNYRDYLIRQIAQGKKGLADLCVYFILRADQITTSTGRYGFLATNTVTQGTSHDIGLAQIIPRGRTIYRAASSQPWPGSASVEIVKFCVAKDCTKQIPMLDDVAVEGIGSRLNTLTGTPGEPRQLAENANRTFLGSKTSGVGFILDYEEAKSLLNVNDHNRDVVIPFLNGHDINSRLHQIPSRYAIFFKQWPLERAAEYPECLDLLRARVKPERDNNRRKIRRENWWLFGEPTPGLYAAVRNLTRVLVRSRVSNLHIVTFVPTGYVYSEASVVFACGTFDWFAVLQSSLHTVWVDTYRTTMRTDPIYTPSKCFETYPCPRMLESLSRFGEQYYTIRDRYMESHAIALNETYGHFNDGSQNAKDVRQFREAHVEMDQAVAAAYGWTDLDLGHGFHETKQGIRYTISEPARREVLDRLLMLNHERYAEEVAQGLHETSRKTKAARKGAQAVDMNGTLLHGLG